MKEIQQEQKVNKKKIYMPSFVFSIITYASSLFVPPVSYICALISFVLIYIKRKETDIRAARAISIVGLIIALANHSIGILFVMNVDKVLEFLDGFIIK